MAKTLPPVIEPDTEPAELPAAKTAIPPTEPRKYRYTGPPCRQLYLPDATTTIDPNSCPDELLEHLFQKFPGIRSMWTGPDEPRP